MKIIGIDEHGRYIATVSREEIEKVFDKYYGKLDRQIKPGDVFDLGAGHNFRAEIQDACRSMVQASAKFDASRSTLTAFAVMVSKLDPAEKPAETA